MTLSPHQINSLAGASVTSSPFVELGVFYLLDGRHAVVSELDYIAIKHAHDTDYLAWLTESINHAVNRAIGPMVSAALQKIDQYSKEES